MKRLIIIAALIAIPCGAADNCMDAVKTAIRGSETINDQWFSVCKQLARTEPERGLCDATHSLYGDVIKKHLK